MAKYVRFRRNKVSDYFGLTHYTPVLPIYTPWKYQMAWQGLTS